MKFWKKKRLENASTEKVKKGAATREFVAEALEARILYSGAPVDVPVADQTSTSEVAPSGDEHSSTSFGSIEGLGSEEIPVSSEHTLLETSEQVVLTSFDNLNADEIKDLARQAVEYWSNAGLDESQLEEVYALEASLIDIVSLSEPGNFEYEWSDSGTYDYGQTTSTIPDDSEQYGIELITDLLREIGDPLTLERLANEQIAARTIEVTSQQLTFSTLDLVADAAEYAWIQSGLTQDQIAALGSIEYHIADLDGSTLGYAEGSHIYIDDDAAGLGWFIDSTPYELSESGFEGIDLVTTLMHEQGHVLGLDHDHSGLMEETLGEGERNTPTTGMAEGAEPLSGDGIHYLLAEAKVSPEALAGMELLYATPGFTNFDNADNYTTDNSASIPTGSFDRVAYYLELDSYWVWVSMDAFQTDPTLVGVPADNSGIVENGTVVTNLVIESNHPNVTSRTIDTGIIEFWASNYNGNGGGLHNSNDGNYDWKDSGGTTSPGHGSFQVADITPGSEEMIFSITGSAMGIGNQPGIGNSPDWTFNTSGITYSARNLEIWVGNANQPPTVTAGQASLSYNTVTGGPQTVNSDITVTDPNDANLTGATIAITEGHVASEDVLGFTLQGGITGSFDSASGTITLSGTASLADYQAVMRSVTYENTSGPAADTGARRVTFTVTDPEGAEGSSDGFISFANPIVSTTYVWDNNSGDSNWSNSVNWDQDLGAPDTNLETAVFRGVDGVVDLGGATITVDEVRFEHSGTLTLTNGTLIANTITMTGSGTADLFVEIDTATTFTLTSGQLNLHNENNDVTGTVNVSNGATFGAALNASGGAAGNLDVNLDEGGFEFLASSAPGTFNGTVTATGDATISVASGAPDGTISNLVTASDITLHSTGAGGKWTAANLAIQGNLNLSGDDAVNVVLENITETAAANLSFEGNAIFELTTANSYTGNTSINAEASLIIRNTGALSGIGTTVNSGGALVLAVNGVSENVTINGAGNTNYSAALTDDTSSTIDFNGTVNVASDATIQSQSGGELDLNGAVTIASGYTLTLDADSTLDFDTTISGDASTQLLITGGAGYARTFRSNPDFHGTVTVQSQGRFDAYASLSFGTGDVYVTGNDASVFVRNGYNHANNFFIEGDGRGTEGAIRSEGSNNTISGVVTLTGAAMIYANNSSLTLTEALEAGGNVLTKDGVGSTSRLVLEKDSVDLPNIDLVHGQLRVKTPGGLGGTSTLDLNADMGIEFDFKDIAPYSFTSGTTLHTLNVNNGAIEVVSGEVTFDSSFTINQNLFGNVHIGGDGTLNLETGLGNGSDPLTNGLDHYGFHISSDTWLNLDGNGGLMGGGDPMTFSNFFGASVLTDGPGSRGLDFNSDNDFINTGSIDQADNYSNLWVGYFTPDASGTWTFRDAGNDDRGGIWFDIDQDGVFESSSSGLGSDRGEQLAWENNSAKTVTLTAGESYLVAFTHREGSSGSRVDFRLNYTGAETSTITGEEIVKPTDPDQAGMWSPYRLTSPQNNIIKVGSGVTNFAVANTYNGSTTIEGGTIVMGDPSSLGLSGGSVVVQNGGTLALDNPGTGVTLNKDFTISGSNAIVNLAGDHEITGTITGVGLEIGIESKADTLTLSNSIDLGIGTITFGGDGDINATGDISGDITPGFTATTPNIISGLEAWYDASSLNLNDGDAVTAWNDLSGNNRHLKTYTGTPTFEAGEIGGLPAVRFDSDENLQLVDPSNEYFAGDVYLVFRSGNGDTFGPSWGAPIGVKDGDDADRTWMLQGNEDRFWSSELPASVTRNGVAISSANSFDLGNVDTSEYMVLQVAAGPNNGTQVREYIIGSRTDAWGNSLFDTAEILAFDHELSANEKEIVQAYLATKYAIGGSFSGLDSPNYFLESWMERMASLSNDIIKEDGGTVTLSGDNSYHGEVTVTNGTLIAASNTALGATTGGTIVNEGGTLALSGGVTIAASEALTLDGDGAGGTGALRNLDGNNTIAGDIAVAINYGGSVTIGSDADRLIIDGDIQMNVSNLKVTGEGDITVNGAFHSPESAPIVESTTFTSKVPEAADYSVVYEIALPNGTQAWNTNEIPYSTNNTETVADFDRVAYYMELDNGSGLQWVYVSMDAFTNDASQLGIPSRGPNGSFTDVSGAFQQIVTNMNVVSNVLDDRTGIDGNIEFWSSDYTSTDGGIVAGDSNGYDIDDLKRSTGSYGSMQIHDFNANETLFGYNAWGSGSGELGIGNNPSPTNNGVDWTFANNAGTYTVKNLIVLARQLPPVNQLIKEGNGNLVLKDTNTYLGDTTVNDGTLTVDGEIGSGLVTVASGASLAGTGIINAQVDAVAGSVTPAGSGVTGSLTVAGTLNFGTGSSESTFSVDIDSSTTDTIVVTDAVNLTDVVLDATRLGSIADGAQFTLIDNQSANAVTGTFSGLADGDEVTSLQDGDTKAYISYYGGDGNDVTLTFIDTANPAPLVVNGVDGDTEFLVKVVGNSVQVIKDPNGTPQVIATRPLAAAHIEINGDDDSAGGEGDDTFILDYSDPKLLQANITVNGMNPTVGTGDKLIITGGTFSVVTHNLTASDSGNLDLDGDNVSDLSYTGLEPVIIQSGTATDFIFNLPAGADQAQLSDIGGGNLRLESLNGTFESTDFAPPSGSITINGGTGDLLTVMNNVNLGTATFEVNLASVNLSGDVITTGNQSYNAAVILGASAEVKGNDVTFSSTLDLAAHTLTLDVEGAGAAGGKVSGAGSLTKEGIGAFVLSNTGNNYSGTTTVTAGTLEGVGGGNFGTSNIVLNGGDLKLDGDSVPVRSTLLLDQFDGTNPGDPSNGLYDTGGDNDSRLRADVANSGTVVDGYVGNWDTNWELDSETQGPQTSNARTFSGNLTYTATGYTSGTADGHVRYFKNDDDYNLARGLDLGEDDTAKAYYFSVLVNQIEPDGENRFGEFILDFGTDTTQSVKFGFEKNTEQSSNTATTGHRIYLESGGTRVTGADSGFSTGVTHLIYGKIDIDRNGNETVTMWLDPTDVTSDGQMIATATESLGIDTVDLIGDGATLSQFRFQSYAHDDSTGSGAIEFDQLHIEQLTSPASAQWPNHVEIVGGTHSSITLNDYTDVDSLGTLTSTGPATLTIHSTTEGNTIEFAGATTLGGDLTLVTNDYSIVSLNNISGTAGITKDGNGNLELKTANAYTGLTDIQNGKVQVYSDGALGSESLGTHIAAGGQLVINNTDYSAAETLLLNGSGVNNGGALQSTGDSTFAGVITLESDALIQSNGTSFTITGGIDTAGHEVAFDGSGETTIDTGAIIGTGGIRKSGTGTIILNSANTYNGTTYIDEGILVARHNTALGNEVGDTIVADGGQLRLENNITIGADETITLNGRGTSNNGALLNGADTNTIEGSVILASDAEIEADSTLNLNGSLTLTGDLIADVNSGDTITINGVVSGPGGISDKQDTGTLILSNGANNFEGGITATSGKIVVTADGALGSTAGETNISSGATLELAGTINYTVAETINIAGFGQSGYGALRSSGGDSTIDAAVTLNLTDDATIRSVGGTFTIETALNTLDYVLEFDGTGDFVLPSVISGLSGGVLLKGGTGTATISGDNTYLGETQIAAGTIVAAHANALGGIGGEGTKVTYGGTLALSGGITISDEPLTLYGLGADDYSGALVNLSGNNFIATTSPISSKSVSEGEFGIGSVVGTLTIESDIDLQYSGLTFAGEGDVVVNGQISGHGVVNNAINAVLPATGYATGDNQLYVFGYHIVNDNLALDLDSNGGMMGLGDPSTFNNFEGAGLLTGPLDLRGANGSDPFRAIAATLEDDASGDGFLIDQDDNYSALIVGTLNVSEAEAGDWKFSFQGTDDRSGFWIDLDGDGVFESTANGLGSGRGEQVSYDDTTERTVNLDPGNYLIAFTHREGTSTSDFHMQFTSPQLSKRNIDPSEPEQDGYWNTHAVYHSDNTLTKMGSGTVTLAGDNSYEGETSVDDGTLVIAHNNALGTLDAGTTVAHGATLALDNTLVDAADGLPVNSSNLTVAEQLTVEGDSTESGTIRNIKGNNTLSGTIEVKGVATLGSGHATIASDADRLTIEGDATFAQLNFEGDGNSLVSGRLHNGFSAEVLLSQDFENFGDGSDDAFASQLLIEGWVNDNTDDVDWVSDKGGTPSGDTGPSVDHTLGTASGTYMYVEASSNAHNKTARMISPQIDLTDYAAAQLEFYYHMWGNTIGTLSVQASTDDGASWSGDLFSLTGEQQANQADPYQRAFIDLTPFVGTSTLRLRVTNVTGSTYSSDIAVDDFRLIALPVTPTPLNSEVVKNGTGTLILSGDNTYDGSTTVAEGTLVAANNGALGTLASGTTVADGAVLALDNTLQGTDLLVAEDITLRADASNPGVLRNVAGDNSVSGGIFAEEGTTGNIGIESANDTLTIQGDIALNLSGIIVDGAGDIQVDGQILAGATLTNTYDTTVLADEPLVYWRLSDADQSNGATATNLGSLNSGGDGTYLAPTGTIDPVADPAIAEGSAIGIRGDQKEGIGRAFSGDFPGATATFEGWFRGDADPHSGGTYSPALFSYEGSGSGGTANEFIALFSGNNLLIFANGQSTTTAVTKDALLDNTWHHLAITLDTTVGGGIGTARVYLDGQLVGSPVSNTNWATALSGSGQFVAGYEQDGALSNGNQPEQGFVGDIAEIAIYDKVLDATKVQNHYAEGLVIPAEPTNALTKTGSGTLTLTNANTWESGTTVADGTLLANNTTGSATGTGNVTVQTSATLGGSGAVSGAVITTGGTVNTGLIAPADLTDDLGTGDLTLDSTSILTVELDPGADDYDQINVIGQVNLDSDTSGGAQLQITMVSGSAPANATYTIVVNDTGSDAVAGRFSNAPNDGDIVTATDGITKFRVFYNANDGNDIMLVEATPLATVYVDDSFTQNTGESIADADLGASGNQAATYGVNAFRTLSEALAAASDSATIIVNGGTYTETVSLSGTQTLEITGPNFAATVTIDTLSAVSGTSIVIEGSSTLTVGDATDQTIAGVISGSGNLVKTGTGMLTLSGADSSATGTTTVKAGILAWGAHDVLPSGNVTVESGATVDLTFLSGSTSTGSSRVYLIEGTGSAGQGALINSTGNIVGSGVAVKGLTLNGNATVSTPARLDVGGPIDFGSYTLTKIGSDSLAFRSTVNSPSGTLIVSEGSSYIEQNNMTLDAITLNNGTAFGIYAYNGSPGRSVSANITINGSATLRHGSNGTPSTPNTWEGTININGGTATFQNAGFNSNTSDVSFNSVISGTGTIVLDGNHDDRSIALNAANPFSGTVRLIDRGTLKLGNELALQNATFDTLTTAVGTLDFTTLEAATFGGLTGSNDILLENASSAPVALTVGNNNADTIYSGSLSGTGSLVKIGTGQLELAGSSTNDYTGNTTVSSGILHLNKSNGNAVGGNLNLDGGKVTFGGSHQIADTSTVTITNASSVLNGTAANVNNQLVTETFANLFVNAGVFNTGFESDWTISGAGTFTGGAGNTAFLGNSGSRISFGNLTVTDMTASGVTLGAPNSFIVYGNGTNFQTTVTVGSGGLTLDNSRFNMRRGNAGALGSRLVLDGDVTVLGTNTSRIANDTGGGSTGVVEIELSSAAGAALRDFDIAAAAELEIDIAINDGSATFGSISKSGLGTLTLNSANTYQGTTTIESGTLLLNGSHTGGDDYQVATGAVLAGVGSTTSQITSIGTVAPGESGAGDLATGDLVFRSGSNYLVDIDGNTPGDGAGNHDQLLVTGTVTLQPTPNIIFVSNSTGSDQDTIDFLTQKFGANITTGLYQTLTAADVAALNAADLVIFSRSSDSSYYVNGNGVFADGEAENTFWEELQTPTILMNAYLARSSRWDWVDTDNLHTGTSAAGDETTLTPEGEIDSLFAGLENPADLYSLNFDAIGNASVGEGTILALGDTDKIFAARWNAGDALGSDGRVAGGDRLFLAAKSGDNVSALTPDGQTVLEKAITELLSPTLEVTVTSGPDQGAAYVIIDNDGATDAVTGTFKNLEEGATVKATGGETFTITYAGGDGNDVVLFAGEAETEVSFSNGVLTVTDINTDSTDNLTISYDSSTNEYVISDSVLNLTTSGLDGSQMNRPDAKTVRVDASIVTDLNINSVNSGGDTSTDTITIASLPADINGSVTATAETINVGNGIKADSISLNGAVNLTTNVVLDTSDIDGSITIAGPGTITGGGNDLAFLTGNGDGTIDGAASGIGHLSLPDTGIIEFKAGLSVDTASVGLEDGGSTLVVSAGAVNIGDGDGNFYIARETTSNSATRGTVDFSAASEVTINVSSVRLNSASGTGSGNIVSSLALSLNGTNNITADSVTLSNQEVDGGGFITGTSTLTLGNATNIFNVDALTVGGRKAEGNVTMAFEGTGGTLLLSDRAGTGAADLFIADNNIGTGAKTKATLDLSGGTFNATIDELLISRQSGLTGSATGSLIIGAGTVDVGRVTMATAIGTNPQNTFATLAVYGGSINVSTGVSEGNGNSTIIVADGTMTVASGFEVDNLSVGVDGGNGTLTVNGGLVELGEGDGAADNLYIGRNTNNSTSVGTVDLRDAHSVVIGVDEILIGTNTTDGGGNNRGVLQLATNGANQITADTILVSDATATGAGHTVTSSIELGQSNDFRVDNFIIGGDKGTGSVTIVDGGTFDLTGKSGAMTGSLDIGLRTVNTGLNGAGTLDLSNGSNMTINVEFIRLGTITTGSASGDSVGTWNFSDSGINSVTAESIIIGDSPTTTNLDVTSSINLGQTNTINTNALLVGSRQSQGRVTIDNGGSLTLNGKDGSGTEADLIIGQNTPTSSTSLGIFDLSGGATFNATLDQFEIGNKGDTGAGSARGVATLATDSNITANIIIVGQSGNSGFDSIAQRSELHLGGGTTNIEADQILVGIAKTRGIIDFATAGGTVNIGTLTNRTGITLGNKDRGTANSANGELDFSDGTANIYATQIIVGSETVNSSGGVPAGTIKLGLGTLDASGNIEENNVSGGDGISTLTFEENSTVNVGGYIDVDTITLGSATSVQTTFNSNADLRDGKLILELEGTNGAGTVGGHDQLIVNGVVTLTDIELDLSASFATAPDPGSVFVLIDNDLSDKINGTFVDSTGDPLPEGTVISVDGHSFVLTYTYDGGADGNGNDVALISGAPETRVELTSSGELKVTDIGNDSSDTLSISYDATTNTYTVQETDSANHPELILSTIGLEGAAISRPDPYTVVIFGDIATVTSLTVDTTGTTAGVESTDKITFETPNGALSLPGAINLTAADIVFANTAEIDQATGGGNLTLNADNRISFSSDTRITTIDSDVILNTTGTIPTGEIVMADGSTIDAGSADIEITADGDITIGGLKTSGSGVVKVTSINGNIIDGGDTHRDIDAPNAVLNAGGSAGLGNAIDTAIGNLEGSISGSLFINNLGNLNIGGADTTADCLVIGGNLNLVNDGAITDSEASKINGSTTIDAGAGNDIVLDDSENLLTGSVSVINGRDVTLVSGTDLTLDSSTVTGNLDITVSSGDILIENSDISADGDVTLNADDNFTLHADASIVSNNGQINITVDQTGVDDPEGSSVEILGTVNAFGNVFISGGNDRDQFNIVPSVFSVINIDGKSPTLVDDGDILNTLNAINPQRTVVVDGFSGTFSFGGGQKAINYTDIERDNVPSLEIDIPISQRLFPTTVNGSFTDFGLIDSHVLEVDWKDPDGGVSTFTIPSFNGGLAPGMIIASSTDGMQLQITGMDPTTGEVEFTVSHIYQKDGLYQIDVAVTDSTDAKAEASAVAEVYFLAPDSNGTGGFFSFAALPGRFTLTGISGLFQDYRFERLFVTDGSGHSITDLPGSDEPLQAGVFISLEGDVRIVFLTGPESEPTDVLSALNNSILNGTPLDLSGNALFLQSQNAIQLISELIEIDIPSDFNR
ncbi:MAG: autotransporter-associated beta strand repeat-containing protein [Verrucomicrobiales bacterium]|nr:autotransporter-associated beta strand repeat-containing protein [Verrucomicrobiales bacterium]